MSTPFVEHDTAPSRLTYKVQGTAVDITGYSFTLKIGYGTPLVKVATITNAAAGEFEFPWGVNDLVKGRWPAEIMITFPDATTRTQKLPGFEILGRIA